MKIILGFQGGSFYNRSSRQITRTSVIRWISCRWGGGKVGPAFVGTLPIIGRGLTGEKCSLYHGCHGLLTGFKQKDA
jgi:hypothetical protein